MTAGAPPKPGPNDWGARTFECHAVGQHYSLSLPQLGIVLDIDHLRRERGELHGHLTATCEMAGARTIGNGVLLSGTTNLGSIIARKKLGEMLADRALAPDVDFHGLVEELALKTEQAESVGVPAVSLRDVTPTAEEDAVIDVYGLKLPRQHPAMIYGLGDSLKSQVVLMCLGELESRGVPTLLVDFEMHAGDHAARLLRMYGPSVPPVTYVRADRPLVHEVDRLRRVIHDRRIQYCAIDSVGFGTDGPPEGAEQALSFMRAVRQLGIGTLLVAHQAKGENGDKTPFGSAFWFNSCRVVYHVKRSEAQLAESVASVALYPTKSNLFRRGGPVGLEFTFTDTETTVQSIDVADMGSDLASRLSVPQRMRATLARGPLTVKALAEELDVPENTITQNVLRGTKDGKRRWLTKVQGSDGVYRVGLLAKAG